MEIPPGFRLMQNQLKQHKSQGGQQALFSLAANVGKLTLHLQGWI